MMGQSDGDFILWDKTIMEPPPRPENPLSYPESDSRRWYDYEYSGWRVKKLSMPLSPKTGPKGKRIVVSIPFHHPYWMEYERGLKKEAARYGMEIDVHNSDWDQEHQSRLVDKIIEEPPDLVIFIPVDPFTSTDLLRRLWENIFP